MEGIFGVSGGEKGVLEGYSRSAVTSRVVVKPDGGPSETDRIR